MDCRHIKISSSLFLRTRCVKLEQHKEEPKQEVPRPFTLEELHLAISTLLAGKAADLDDFFP